MRAVAIVVAVVESRCVGGGEDREYGQAMERDEICLENDSVESNMKQTEIFGRQAGHYEFGGRKRERDVDYFRDLLRETDKKKFSFRGIESKIIRRHPRRDESDSGLKVVYGRREDFRNKRYEELGVISI